MDLQEDIASKVEILLFANCHFGQLPVGQ